MLLAGRSLSPLLSFLFPAGTHSLTHSHKAGADIHVHTPLACIHLPAKYPFDVTKTTILCKRFINRPQCESFCLPVCVSLYRPFLSVSLSLSALLGSLRPLLHRGVERAPNSCTSTPPDIPVQSKDICLLQLNTRNGKETHSLSLTHNTPR